MHVTVKTVKVMAIATAGKYMHWSNIFSHFSESLY